MEVKWSAKAPDTVKIDDILVKLANHYGHIYTNKIEFVSQVLIPEQSYPKPGNPFPCPALNQQGFTVRQVCLSDESFKQSNFFVQALLPFFIEAATPIEPCAFWKYFLVYN